VATIGLVLPYAVGVALSPMAIVAVIVLTRSAHADVNGGAFVVGWLLGLVVATLALVLLAGVLGAGATPRPTWVEVARLVGGVLLLLFAWERAGARRSADGPGRSWVAGLGRASADRALAMGAVQAALDPRKLVVIAATALVLAGAGEGSTQALVSLVVFALVGTVGVALPIVWPRVAGARAHARLEAIGDRLADDSATIQAVTLLLLGALLAGQGLAGL
jgi:hypothetical protein